MPGLNQYHSPSRDVDTVTGLLTCHKREQDKIVLHLTKTAVIVDGNDTSWLFVR